MSAVTFHEGRPCAPINSPELERDALTRVTAYCVDRGGNPPDECSFRLGIRHGWLAGWHAGFEAASVDTLPKGQDAKQGLAGTEGSAVAATSGETPTPGPAIDQDGASDET